MREPEATRGIAPDSSRPALLTSASLLHCPVTVLEYFLPQDNRGAQTRVDGSLALVTLHASLYTSWNPFIPGSSYAGDFEVDSLLDGCSDVLLNFTTNP